MFQGAPEEGLWGERERVLGVATGNYAEVVFKIFKLFQTLRISLPSELIHH